MKRIALLSCAQWPDLTDDDRLLMPALRRLGIVAVPVVWDAPVDWGQFEQVVIRSCWDYHLRANEFLDWIERLETSGTPTQNSPELIRWNIDKRYLRQARTAGVSIPATVWVEERAEVSLHEILDAQCWYSAIVKPTVSASAHNLRRIFKNEPDVLVKGPAIIQEFIPEIITSGEWSLVFFGGEYSHAVIKRPATGDFRVQREFGGSTAVAKPPNQVIDEATKLVAALPGKSLYARIDGVDRGGRFILIEVELIEPVLFLGLGNAADRLAAEIARLISGHDIGDYGNEACQPQVS